MSEKSQPSMLTDAELAQLSDAELLDEYEATVEQGAALGSRRMNIGPAVMKGDQLKSEMKDRGIWSDRDA